MAEASLHLPMKPETGPVDIAGEEITGPRHACAFFEGLEEEYDVLLPFTAACAKCADRCFHFLDARHKAERVRRLEQAGVNASREPVELRSWEETYLRGGRFVVAKLLEVTREVLERKDGACRARVWANMEWALQDVPLEQELIEYENRLNPLIDRTGGVVICAYYVGRYSPELALGVLRAHPWILVDGKLESNPAYLPAETGTAIKPTY
jgi:hypothetical protein